MLGYLIQDNCVHLLKSTFGRLRPNFISVCQPNVDLLNCTTNKYFQVNEYKCINENVEQFKSFPSGHTSAVIYYAFFIIVNFFLL